MKSTSARRVDRQTDQVAALVCVSRRQQISAPVFEMGGMGHVACWDVRFSVRDMIFVE